MRFTTLSFFVFFAAVYIIYWMLKGRSRIIFLLPVSALFYIFWSPLFALHFFTFIVINYLLVRMLFYQKRVWVLWLGIILNSANLFFFKYFYLFLKLGHDFSGLALLQEKEFNAVLESVSGVSSIIQPLAISFYTFLMLAFLIDTWRGKITEDPGFINYSVFVMFFPQLAAGPIMRHSDFFHQLSSIQPKAENTRTGIFLILLGFIKKVLIADNLASPVNDIFFHPEKYDSITIAMGAAGYAMRVYGDFSGYTDMARGTSLLLGITLPINFRGPFLSRSLQEIWGRWHITLSTWLRDYIYIPLGGSRTGPLRHNLNTVITFTLGGLWHGANYTYIVWGFFHGVMLVIENYTKNGFKAILRNLNKSGNTSLPEFLKTKYASAFLGFSGTFLAVFYTFGFFSIGVIFFNSPDMAHALTMLQILFSGSFDPARQSPFLEQIIYAGILVFLLNYAEYKDYKIKIKPVIQSILLVFMAIATLILLTKFSPEGADFIYFQF
jgi:alginate O-acetyltransferase complex protein AlgI